MTVELRILGVPAATYKLSNSNEMKNIYFYPFIFLILFQDVMRCLPTETKIVMMLDKIGKIWQPIGIVPIKASLTSSSLKSGGRGRAGGAGAGGGEGGPGRRRRGGGGGRRARGPGRGGGLQPAPTYRELPSRNIQSGLF